MRFFRERFGDDDAREGVAVFGRGGVCDGAVVLGEGTKVLCFRLLGGEGRVQRQFEYGRKDPVKARGCDSLESDDSTL